MAGYGEFATVYDLLTENVPYNEIADYYDSIITELSGKRGLLLDIGCGTGNLTMRMAEKGYDVVAADVSVEMLSIAMSKPHDGIQYICQGMTELDLYGAVDVAISTLDSVNHLDTPEDIKECFRNVSENLEQGGLFLFDVNTVYKHRNILAGNTFVYDVEGVYCVWQNEYSAEHERVTIELDLFYENDDGSYDRGYESFSEIAVEQQVLEQYLDDAGFEVLAVYEYLTKSSPKDDSDKLLIAARKI